MTRLTTLVWALVLCASRNFYDGVSAASATGLPGSRVLVVLGDKAAEAESYSKFVGSLKDRGYVVDVQDSKEAQLLRYDERLYDQVVLFPPAKSSWTNIDKTTLVDFVTKGGNILLTANTENNKAVKQAAREFGVGISLSDNTATSVVNDKFQAPSKKGKPPGDGIITNNFASWASPAVVSSTAEPVFFKGIAHGVDKANSLLHTVLYATSTSTTMDSDLRDNVSVGGDLKLVSILQARNDARFAFAGSTELFSNSAWSFNERFVKDLTQWLFKEKSVLRVKKVYHHKKGEVKSKDKYRIKDEIVYEIDLEEKNADGKWVPFQLPAGDVLPLEMNMLYTYERVHLLPSNSTRGRYVTPPGQVLPDHVGVYTFRVHYQRFGKSVIDDKKIVSIVPFRHNEFPYIVFGAYPYYVAAWSMAISWFIFVTVFLYYRDDAKDKTN